jgi:anti-anti-sigma factor
MLAVFSSSPLVVIKGNCGKGSELMKITERVIGDAIVLGLNGKLTGVDAHLLDCTVDRLVRAGWRTLIVDLAGVPAIDANGLGALVGAYRTTARSQTAMRFIHVTSRIHSLIAITRLVTVLDTFDSLEEALNAGRTPIASAPSSARYWAPVQRFLREA